MSNIMGKSAVILCIAFYLFFFWYIKYIHKKKKDASIKKVKKKKNHRNWLHPLYKIYTKIPILNKTFFTLKNRIMLLYPTDIIEVNSRVTKNMTIGLASAVGIFSVICLTAQGDIFYICLGGVVTYVIFTHIINMSFERSDIKLLDSFYTFLTDMRHNFYISNKRITDALYMSKDKCSYEMGLHANVIHKILKSQNMNEESEKYIQVAPNRFVLLFVAICTTIKQYGDKEIDGNSLFLENIRYLKEEIHIEKQKIRSINMRFSGLVFITLLPLFFIKPTQWWAAENMPELMSFYNGSAGTIWMIIIFLSSIVSYSFIISLKSLSQKEMKTHPWLESICKIRIVRKILTIQINRNYSKAERINDKLKLIGEHMGYQQFLLKRYLYAVAFVIGFQLIVVGAQAAEKHNILTNFQEAFETSYVTDQEIVEEMKYASEMYLQDLKNAGVEISREALVEDIKDNTTLKKQLYAELVADEILIKLEEFHQIYYRWWYLLIGIAAAVTGFYFPLWMIIFKEKSMKMNMEDEVNQYQTLVMMLMHVDNMSVGKILEWMERFSYCFRESITICISELPHGQQKALTKLKNSETFEPFKRFINNMLIVKKQGLVAAFGEIVTERKNNAENRRRDNEEIASTKGLIGIIFAVIPSVIYIAAYVIYPLMSISQQIQDSIPTMY